MAKMTLKNTKQEILDALNDAQKKLAAQKAAMSVPAAAAETARENAVVEQAELDVSDGIFSDEMNDKFMNLRDAIKLQARKLKEYYGVESVLIDMTTALNAQKQAQLDAAAETEAARAEAKRVAESLRAENEQLKAELKQAREREQSEYDYNLSRRRRIAEDQVNDEIAQMNKKADAVRAELAVLTADADKLAAQQARIDGLDAELEAKYQEGVEAGTKAAGKDYGYKTAMADKDHQYELRERDSKIERMASELTEKTEKIASLEAKLDAAYSQLRDLAAKTVESSGGVKIIGAGDSSNGRK